MTMQKSTGGGAILKLSAGSLMRECCCGGSPSSCPDGDPEMLLTVSGSSGTVNWCGETWNLPADSGDQRTVCPTLYKKRAPSSGYYTTRSNYVAGEYWRHFISGGNQLELYNGYNIFRNSPAANWSRYQGGQYQNQQNILFAANAVSAFDRIIWYLGSNSVKPVPPLIASQLNSDFGILATNAPPYASNSQWSVQDTWFTSYVSGGITYAWAKGNGW